MHQRIRAVGRPRVLKGICAHCFVGQHVEIGLGTVLSLEHGAEASDTTEKEDHL